MSNSCYSGQLLCQIYEMLKLSKTFCALKIRIQMFFYAFFALGEGVIFQISRSTSCHFSLQHFRAPSMS